MTHRLGDRAFFLGMETDHLSTLEDASGEVCFAAGSTIFREGGAADAWYLLTDGVVILEVDIPGRGPHTLQTLHPGDILGWSWLFPPYRWSFDAYARTDVEAIRFDGAALRAAAKLTPAFGYELMRRFAEVLVQRMQAARLQVLDIYGASR